MKLPDQVKAVVMDLKELSDDLGALRTPRDEKVLGAELVKIWDAAMHGEENEYTDWATLRNAGIAKRIADEYDLPGEFKE